MMMVWMLRSIFDIRWHNDRPSILAMRISVITMSMGVLSMQARACSPLCATADTVSPKAPQLIEHWRASVTESSSSTRSTWNISLQLLLVSGRKRNTERHTGAVARRAREQEPICISVLQPQPCVDIHQPEVLVGVAMASGEAPLQF